MNIIESNKKIGYWTVKDSSIIAPSGERKWLCKCVCGTERYVLERSLIYGLSSSCGCINRAKAKTMIEHNLLGQQFGDLKVLQKAEKKERNGGTWWVCRCSCGKEIEVSGTLLVNNRKTSCGCKNVKNYFYQDITGENFGRLTAQYPLQKRDLKGGVIWNCKCSCGNETEVSYNALMYSEIRSCGCQKREHESNLAQYLTHIDNTSIDAIRSKKIREDNTTGFKGVYLVRGKYIAKIVFQKKQYNLGTYEKIEDAIKVRQEAEKLIFGTVIEHYEKWKTKANTNKEWAKEHPFRINVEKDSSTKEIQVLCSPHL